MNTPRTTATRCPLKQLVAGALLAATAGASQAHAVLDKPQAPAGSSYQADVRIGHGCEGTATHTVTVQLPAGLRGAKPVPKAGWALSLRKAALAQPYTSHGKTISEDVVEISWTARTPDDRLQDAWVDQFSLRGQLPGQAGPLWFKVTQLCEQGRWDWVEVPASGTSTQGLKAPALLLEVQPAAPAGHQH